MVFAFVLQSCGLIEDDDDDDDEAPEISTFTINNGEEVTNSKTVSIQLSVTIPEVQVYLGSDSSCSEEAGQWFDFSEEITYDLPEEGDKEYSIYAKIAIGDLESSCIGATITLDTTPPEFDFTIDGGASGTILVEIQSEDGSQMEISLSQECTTEEWTEFAESSELAIDSIEESTVYVAIRLRDLAGNVTECLVKSIVRDTDNSAIELAGLPEDPSSDAQLNVTVSSKEASEYEYELISGEATCEDINYDGGLLPMTQPITDALEADGKYTLCVKVIDSAKNMSYASHSWTKESNGNNSFNYNLVGLPETYSNTRNISITLESEENLQYSYVLAQGHTHQCQQRADDQDEWHDKSKAIEEKLSKENNSLYTLCIYLRKAEGESATQLLISHKWTLRYTWDVFFGKANNGNVSEDLQISDTTPDNYFDEYAILMGSYLEDSCMMFSIRFGTGKMLEYKRGSNGGIFSAFGWGADGEALPPSALLSDDVNAPSQNIRIIATEYEKNIEGKNSCGDYSDYDIESQYKSDGTSDTLTTSNKVTRTPTGSSK